MASTTMYNNYQLPPSQYSSGRSQQTDLLDDSIYSTTPFGGGSVFSPSVTARETMTPRERNVHFDFPPELRSASSSESSTSGDELAFAQPTKLVAAAPTSTPRSSKSISMVSYSNSRLIRVPRSQNPHGADAVHPKKKNMKKQRKRRTAAGTVAGMAVGGLVLGPVGVFVGAAAGGVAANKIHKCRERRAQRKYEQKSFQQGATRSKTAQAGTFA